MLSSEGGGKRRGISDSLVFKSEEMDAFGFNFVFCTDANSV